MKRSLASGVLDRDRWDQLAGLRADVVLPADFTGIWLQGHDEAAAGEDRRAADQLRWAVFIPFSSKVREVPRPLRRRRARVS